MAQSSASMGPPLSPREIRRSGRRSATSQSNSSTASKSPELTSPTESRPKEGPSSARKASTAPSSNRRGQRRQNKEDTEEGMEDAQRSTAASSTSSTSATQGRAKRKGKAKQKEIIESNAAHKLDLANSRDPSVSVQEEEEEQGITRCICGSTEDDPDAGEFMVQCETCKAWQHGLCMGYEAETQLPDDDYHCEQCRPDLHVEIIKKSSKRARHSSTTSFHTSNIAATSSTSASRLSRSRSPSQMLKPAKRRNTMNSRDANFETVIKETLAATAAEAQAASHDDGAENPLEPEEDLESSTGKRRRKQSDDAAATKKRTRSISTTSDHPIPSTTMKEDAVHTPKAQTSVPSKSSSRNRRGGARKSASAAIVMIQEVGAPDADDAPPSSSKRPSNTRNRSSHSSRRPAALHASAHVPGSESRRVTGNATGAGGGGGGSGGAGGAASTAAYRQSHAYAVAQQPLYTSWNLPDYLVHLQEMLPSDLPKPLEVHSSGLGGGEVSMERGVKVKWPSKRMSVGDMNKRVRSLVEWVGREQAAASERDRRKAYLEARIKAAADEDPPSALGEEGEGSIQDSRPAGVATKMMEELMEELIGFQERFGLSAKIRDRRAPTS